jgi:hypothetical protein
MAVSAMSILRNIDFSPRAIATALQTLPLAESF